MPQQANIITWIPVQVSDGMFSNESAVTIILADGREVSIFADNSLIKEKGSSHLLKVTLVNKYPAQHKQLVLLPTETFETASRWIEISA